MAGTELPLRKLSDVDPREAAPICGSRRLQPSVLWGLAVRCLLLQGLTASEGGDGLSLLAPSRPHFSASHWRSRNQSRVAVLFQASSPYSSGSSVRNRSAEDQQSISNPNVQANVTDTCCTRGSFFLGAWDPLSSLELGRCLRSVPLSTSRFFSRAGHSELRTPS